MKRTFGTIEQKIPKNIAKEKEIKSIILKLSEISLKEEKKNRFR